MMIIFNKYDVVFGYFPERNGSAQSGSRPGIVIQNDVGNRYSPTLIVIPLTSKLKNLNQATHLFIRHDQENGLRADSVLLAEQIITVDKKSVKKIGHISNRNLQKSIFRCFIYSAAYGENDDDLKEIQICWKGVKHE